MLRYVWYPVGDRLAHLTQNEGTLKMLPHPEKMEDARQYRSSTKKVRSRQQQQQQQQQQKQQQKHLWQYWGRTIHPAPHQGTLSDFLSAFAANGFPPSQQAKHNIHGTNGIFTYMNGWFLW